MVFLLAVVGLIVIGVKCVHEWRASKGDLPRKVVVCIGGVCALCFLAQFSIGALPSEFLEHIEFPNAPGGDRLTAPDGRVFIVSVTLARVQRYGPDGFEKGFMYHQKADGFAVSPSGNILICTLGKVLFTYDPDGSEILPRGSCEQGFGASPSTYSSHARVPVIAFNWFSAVAVPLWHPVAAWLIAVLTALLYWLLVKSRPA